MTFSVTFWRSRITLSKLRTTSTRGSRPLNLRNLKDGYHKTHWCIWRTTRPWMRWSRKGRRNSWLLRSLPAKLMNLSRTLRGWTVSIMLSARCLILKLPLSKLMNSRWRWMNLLLRKTSIEWNLFWKNLEVKYKLSEKNKQLMLRSLNALMKSLARKPQSSDF